MAITLVVSLTFFAFTRIWISQFTNIIQTKDSKLSLTARIFEQVHVTLNLSIFSIDKLSVMLHLAIVPDT